MLKFLRRYNKWILAVFGTLLMIVFLIPQALNTLAQRAGARAAARATIAGGQEVSPLEWEQAQSELLALDRTGIRQQVFPFVEDPEHWFLLSLEARGAGLVGANPFRALTEQDLAALAGASGADARFLGQTTATRDGVLRLIGLYRNAAQPSDRRLREFSRRLLHSVKAEVVVLEADADDAASEPSEQEIRDQFQAHRDVMAGEGEMGFGYRLPDRFKLEWITIEADGIRQVIEGSDEMDRIALYKHWKRNEGRDGLPAFVEGEAVPDVVRQNLLDRLTEDMLDDIAKYAYDQLRARRRGLPEREGFLVLPDDWKQQSLALPALAESIRARFEIELPAYESVGDRWLDMADLADLGEIGRASTDKFDATPQGLGQLVAAAKEFDGDGSVPVQQGVATPPLRTSINGQDGSLYIARITETDPSRPPDSADEVRADVVRDLKRLDAYRQLADSLSTLEAEARDKGMLEMALDRGTSLRMAPEITMCSRQLLELLVQRQLPPQALATSLPVIGADEPTVQAIVDRALQLPMTSDLSEVPETERTFALPVEDKLSVIVVRLLEQNPLTQELYRVLASNNALQALLLESEIDTAAAEEAFSFETMAARHEFELQAPPSTDQPEDLDDPAAADPAADSG
ncbi:MAG: hypothetical protein ACYTGG_02180 [Planctomycetota bacterium]|jgi:hypothetical protein